MLRRRLSPHRSARGKDTRQLTRALEREGATRDGKEAKGGQTGLEEVTEEKGRQEASQQEAGRQEVAKEEEQLGQEGEVGQAGAARPGTDRGLTLGRLVPNRPTWLQNHWTTETGGRCVLVAAGRFFFRQCQSTSRGIEWH
jgi:hypothetical protein